MVDGVIITVQFYPMFRPTKCVLNFTYSLVDNLVVCVVWVEVTQSSLQLLSQVYKNDPTDDNFSFLTKKHNMERCNCDNGLEL